MAPALPQVGGHALGVLPAVPPLHRQDFLLLLLCWLVDLGRETIRPLLDLVVAAPIRVSWFFFISCSVMANPLRGAGSAETTLPTVSPVTIRRILPLRVRSKTTIGSLLSMHSEMAVVSITCSPRLSTSM